jgi:succinate dehydrogenase / fumarate reductase, cytochrome b subunit
MALKRNAVFRGLKYRGGGPMLAWLLHRIGGLAIVIFVGTHVLSSYFQYQLASPLAQNLNVIYESVYFQVVLYFFILFHVINGMRIIILDIFPQALEYQREATWLEWLIFLPIYGLTVFIMLQQHFRGG